MNRRYQMITLYLPLVYLSAFIWILSYSIIISPKNCDNKSLSVFSSSSMILSNSWTKRFVDILVFQWCCSISIPFIWISVDRDKHCLFFSFLFALSLFHESTKFLIFFFSYISMYLYQCVCLIKTMNKQQIFILNMSKRKTKVITGYLTPERKDKWNKPPRFRRLAESMKEIQKVSHWLIFWWTSNWKKWVLFFSSACSSTSSSYQIRWLMKGNIDLNWIRFHLLISSVRCWNLRWNEHLLMLLFIA